MPNEFPRSRRVAEQIQRELSSLIATEIRDPRVALAVVTDVQVSRDLSQAKVFVAAANLSEDSEETIRGLTHAGGFLRSRLGQNMRIRYMPRLRFVEDRTEREAARVERLIKEARSEDRRRGGEDQDGT